MRIGYIFLGNYSTRKQVEDLQKAHKKTWKDIYPHVKYEIERVRSMNSWRYLSWVKLGKEVKG